MRFLIHWYPQVVKMALIAAIVFVLLAVAQHQAPFPQVINKTHLLMVESFDAGQDGYDLTLRSNSPVAVYSVAIAAIGENGVCDLHTLGSLTGSFIGPSGNRALSTLDFPNPKEGGWGPRMGACSETAVREAQPENGESSAISKIVIEAADFEDGSFEGDRSISAMLETKRVARGLQQRRIAELVAKEVESDGSADTDWVKALQTRVSELPVQPDADTVHSLQLRFGPSVITEESIRKEFQDWSEFEKLFILNHLRSYVTESSRRGLPTGSLQTWWNATKGECDFFWPQCSNGEL